MPGLIDDCNGGDAGVATGCLGPPSVPTRRSCNGAFAALFVAAGIGHFIATGRYMRIMPSYMPWHRPLVQISGVFEIALGIMLLVPRTLGLAAWGLIALLVAVFPANVFMVQHAESFPLSPTLLLLRLPLQGVLILSACTYTRR